MNLLLLLFFVSVVVGLICAYYEIRDQRTRLGYVTRADLVAAIGMAIVPCFNVKFAFECLSNSGRVDKFFNKKVLVKEGV